MGGKHPNYEIEKYAHRSVPDSDKYPQQAFRENAYEARKKDAREIDRRMNFEDDMKRDRVSPKAVRKYDKEIDEFAKRSDRVIDSYNPKRYARRRAIRK